MDDMSRQTLYDKETRKAQMSVLKGLQYGCSIWKAVFFFHAQICMTNIFIFYIFFSNFVCLLWIHLSRQYFPHMETPPNNNEDKMCLWNTDVPVWKPMAKVEVSQIYVKIKGQGQRVQIVSIRRKSCHKECTCEIKKSLVIPVQKLIAKVNFFV